MDIGRCYKILKVTESTSNENISRSYKKLAHLYHPDKNRNRIEWANMAMKQLNTAYSSVMSDRFRNVKLGSGIAEDLNREKEPDIPKSNIDRKKRERDSGPYNYYEDRDNSDYLIDKFIKIRESAKDSLYRFFQYNLNNLIKRETPQNRGIFNRIVFSLRKSYHLIGKLKKDTDNEELLEHFNVFRKMIFDFYRASECLNVIDSYSNQLEVDAYRLFKHGDDALHHAHREIFYDRHNRGQFRMLLAGEELLNAINIFRKTLIGYPDSSWVVETNIKLEYASSLRKYLELFFTE